MSFGTAPFGASPFGTSGASFFALESATVVSTTAVRLQFSADLDLSTPVLDLPSYTFTGGMMARLVVLEAPDTVLVYTTTQVPNQHYVVEASIDLRGIDEEYLNDTVAIFMGIDAQRRPVGELEALDSETIIGVLSEVVA